MAIYYLRLSACLVLNKYDLRVPDPFNSNQLIIIDDREMVVKHLSTSLKKFATILVYRAQGFDSDGNKIISSPTLQ